MLPVDTPSWRGDTGGRVRCVESRAAPRRLAPKASERMGNAARFIPAGPLSPTSGVEGEGRNYDLRGDFYTCGAYRKDSIRAKKRAGASQNGMCPEEGTTS